MEEIGWMLAKTIQNGRRGRPDGSMKTVSSAKSCGGPAEGRYIWEIKEKKSWWFGEAKGGRIHLSHWEDRPVRSGAQADEPWTERGKRSRLAGPIEDAWIHRQSRISTVFETQDQLWARNGDIFRGREESNLQNPLGGKGRDHSN